MNNVYEHLKKAMESYEKYNFNKLQEAKNIDENLKRTKRLAAISKCIKIMDKAK